METWKRRQIVQKANFQKKNGTSPQISIADKRKHHGCRVPAGIRGTSKTDRPNTLGDMQPAFYEPIHRQGTRNRRGGAGWAWLLWGWFCDMAL